MSNINCMLVMVIQSLLSLAFSSCSTGHLQQVTILTNSKGDEYQIRYSPDGKKIAFVSQYTGDSKIHIVSITDRKTSQVSRTIGSHSHPVWSNDGNKLAYEVATKGENFVVVQKLDSDQLLEIKSPGVKYSRPQWSPDDSKLVINGVDSIAQDIHLYSFADDEVTKLTTEPGLERHFGFSFDGKYVGYNKRGGTEEDLFAISTDGMEEINITKHPGHEWYPQWSPKAMEVVFYSTWGDEMTEVHKVNLQGELINISQHHVEDFGQRISPDGNRVVYISKRSGHNDLFVYDFQSTITVQLGISKYLKRGWPEWSPNGKTLAFSSDVEEDRLYRLHIESGLSEVIRSINQPEEWPSISGDGRYMAFVTTGEGSEANIHLWDQMEESEIQLLATYHNQTRPQFSNISNKLAFIQSAGGSLTTNDIYTINPDGSDSTRLTSFGGVRHFIWSPDDSEIYYAYDSATNYFYDLWVLDVQSGLTRPLSLTKYSEIPTSISPDGNTLLLQRGEYQSAEFYRYDIATQQVIAESATHGQYAKYSPDGKWIAFISNENKEKFTDLYLMAADGSQKKRLTNDHYDEESPEWDKDGKSIVYSVKKGDRDIRLYHFNQ